MGNTFVLHTPLKKLKQTANAISENFFMFGTAEAHMGSCAQMISIVGSC